MEIFKKIGAQVKKFYWTKKRTNTLKKTKWEEINDSAQQLFNEANKRLAALREEGYYTSAMDRAANELGGATRNFGEFTVRKPTKKQLVEEMFKARQFINSYYSTINGAQFEETRLLSKHWEGAFGKQWYAEYGVTYDKSRIDVNKAKLAFAVFREIEREAAGMLYFNNKNYYDSDNLIRDIYEIVDQNVASGIDIRNVEHRVYEDVYNAVMGKTRKLIEVQKSLLDQTNDPEQTKAYITAELLTGRFRQI